MGSKIQQLNYSLVESSIFLISFILKVTCLTSMLLLLLYIVVLLGAIHADITNTTYWRMPGYKGDIDATSLFNIKIGQYIAYSESMCTNNYITTNQIYCDNIILYRHSFMRAIHAEKNTTRVKVAEENLEISFKRTKFINILFIPIRYIIWFISGNSTNKDPLRY